MVSCVAGLEEPRRLCEKLLAHASDLGLYGEQLDPGTGRHLGNFPQAFTHLALINAVMHVIHARPHDHHAVGPLSPRADSAEASLNGDTGEPVAQPSTADAARGAAPRGDGRS